MQMKTDGGRDRRVPPIARALTQDQVTRGPQEQSRKQQEREPHLRPPSKEIPFSTYGNTLANPRADMETYRQSAGQYHEMCRSFLRITWQEEFSKWV
jgi:hypothetical protein